MDLTNNEAIGLYEHWLEPTSTLVFKAAAAARGRADRHRSDLTDLYRDLGAVGTADLLLPLPIETPGSPAFAAAVARTKLDEAEQLYSYGAHRKALAYLQLAYCAACNAIKQARLEPTETDTTPDGPIIGSLDLAFDAADLPASGPCSGLEAILLDLESLEIELTGPWETETWATGLDDTDTGSGSGPLIPGPRR